MGVPLLGVERLDASKPGEPWSKPRYAARVDVGVFVRGVGDRVFVGVREGVSVLVGFVVLVGDAPGELVSEAVAVEVDVETGVGVFAAVGLGTMVKVDVSVGVVVAVVLGTVVGAGVEVASS